MLTAFTQKNPISRFEDSVRRKICGRASFFNYFDSYCSPNTFFYSAAQVRSIFGHHVVCALSSSCSLSRLEQRRTNFISGFVLK
ncbi:hypothetical protein RB195_002077 [Necator americanus]|uniref:Uncharacterized protein n=1 Tax=Necator americanus TaxID=51031 RepID=A0ABR1DH91_NECAM